MTARVYVTRPIFDQGVERLKREVHVEVNSDERVLSKSELISHLREADGALTLLTDIINREVLDACPRLKVVANFAVGFNNVDIEAATERGVIVTNTPGVLTETTADFAWTLLMAAARRVVEADRFARAGKFKMWGPKMFLGHDVYGKTLGLIGLGRIGQAVARRASGFNMKVIFHDAEPIPEQVLQDLGVTPAPLEELLRISDFISVHVPLLAETKHLLSDRTFAMMKPTCVVVNTSRGPVVDEKALVRALKNGKIAAAALDVFEREPEIEPELFDIDNVVIAPHIASASHETRLKMCMMAAENLLASLKGNRPPNLVNPEVWGKRRS
ncbi:MAG: D-glycerate dehydrogenase [Acidobacteria bacterium]|nr:MAG: D-glycerate dehydrogenase [Acidobacteriota bacterium]